MKNVLATLVFIFTLIPQIHSNEYFFERKSPNAGFAFNELNTIIEDKNGEIWFGSTKGLYKYNSQKIERYLLTNIKGQLILSSYINKLYVDDAKTLWVCTNRGLCTFNSITNSFDERNLQHKNFLQDTEINTQNIVQASDSIYFIIINSQLYKYNIERNKLQSQPTDNASTNLRFKSIAKDTAGNIWVGSVSGQIFVADSSLTSFYLFAKYRNGLVNTFCIDDDFLWVGYTNNGVDKISKEGKLIKHYGKEELGNFKLQDNRIRKIIKRKNGDIWIATFMGIHILSNGSSESVMADQFNNLPDNSIYELMEDSKEGVWIGTWAGGLGYYSDFNYHFRHIKKIPFDSNLSKNNISSFAEDRNGIIWIGSETAGLKTYNKKKHQFESYNITSATGDLISAKYIAIDKNERIWIGTFDNGVWYKDKNKDLFTQLDDNRIKAMKIIHKILITDDGLWIGSHGQGITFYDPKTKNATNYKFDPNKPEGLPSNHIWCITKDSMDNIWLGTDKGICVKTPESSSFKLLAPNDKSNQKTIYTLCEVNAEEIWAGTKEKGILTINKKSLDIKPLDIEWNKMRPEIYNLITDNSGNVWITSDQGIQLYNIASGNLQYFDENDGVLGKNFNPNACIKASSGELYFGSSYGFNVIQPQTILVNPFRPSVYISDIKINNIPFAKTKVKFANSNYLPELNTLTLTHDQNTINFGFVANNYLKSSNNKFKYRLVNYQDNWTNLETKSEVGFTKIPPGKYTLEVLASNNSDLWSNEPYTLKITIASPIWLTTYAYIFYFLILMGVAYLLIKESRYRAKMQKTLLVERFRHDAEEKLFQEKQKFFTNISHEFRTPLTLILSPLNILYEYFKNDPHTAEHLTIIRRNADRLLRLTNEILDFRLIETGRIKLKLKPTDVINVCKNAYDCFAWAAIEKEINYIFSSKYEELFLNIDADKIEKIIYNLLSNAFKFTQEKSQIIVSIDSRYLNEDDYEQKFSTGTKFIGDCLEIRVKNYGKGILNEDLPLIFERFSTKNEQLTAGTGLGLHISQEYIRLHGGNIIVDSIENKETTFIVNIPLDEPLNISKHSIIVQPNFDDFRTETTDRSEDLKLEVTPSEVVILLIEDHMDLRKYLKNILSNTYKVLTASNGIQGYEIALEITPNIIISDVMMPGMDGFALTKKLKENPKSKHIPIILLTALNDTASEIDGISKGADSFLVKPVDEKLLFAHISRLIEDRKQIKQDLANSQTLKEGQQPKSFDKLNFIEKMEFIILENLQNPQFSVEQLSERLNTSRSSLHRKLKKDTNQSVTEFIREMRLKKAIELMKTKKYNLDEIGFYVGYNSHSYFTRSFKKMYGKTPKEFYDELKLNL